MAHQVQRRWPRVFQSCLEVLELTDSLCTIQLLLLDCRAIIHLFRLSDKQISIHNSLIIHIPRRPSLQSLVLCLSVYLGHFRGWWCGAIISVIGHMEFDHLITNNRLIRGCMSHRQHKLRHWSMHIVAPFPQQCNSTESPYVQHVLINRQFMLKFSNSC